MSQYRIESKGPLLSLSVLVSACLLTSLLHNALLIGVKMCLFSSYSSLNLNLKAIRSRSEREEERKKHSAILGYSEPFPSKVTFQTKCLLRYLGHSAFSYFLGNFLPALLPSLLSFPPRLIIKHAQLSQI